MSGLLLWVKDRKFNKDTTTTIYPAAPSALIIGFLVIPNYTNISYYLLSPFLFSQKLKLDSLSNLLSSAENDTTRVELLWRMASAASVYNPDTAFALAFESISLSKDIKNVEGQARATGIMANIFMRIGHYPKALELNIEKLKLVEKEKEKLNLASVLINIGIVFTKMPK